ncbi:AAA family ATPase [Allosphingosinicella humi]
MIDNLHIITGGPGSGKSSLVDALTAAGFRHMPEAGRAIIQDQVAIGGTALPWDDREAFAALMLGWEMRSYREAVALNEAVFFDRGIPDVVGYLRLSGLPVPEHIVRAAELHRYHKRVFITPHWPEIFAQDTERNQTLAEAEVTHRAMAEAYADFGYDLVYLPIASVAERVAFILSHLA